MRQKSEEAALRNRLWLFQVFQEALQMLNRSIYSVKRKAAKMGLSHYNDKLSVAQSFNTEIICKAFDKNLDYHQRK